MPSPSNAPLIQQSRSGALISHGPATPSPILSLLLSVVGAAPIPGPKPVILQRQYQFVCTSLATPGCDLGLELALALLWPGFLDLGRWHLRAHQFMGAQLYSEPWSLGRIPLSLQVLGGSL